MAPEPAQEPAEGPAATTPHDDADYGLVAPLPMLSAGEHRELESALIARRVGLARGFASYDETAARSMEIVESLLTAVREALSATRPVPGLAAHEPAGVGPELAARAAALQQSLATDPRARTARGRFDPLPFDHPSVGEICPLCETPLRVGDRPSLVTLWPADEAEAAKAAGGRAYNGEAAIVHEDCAWTAR